MKRPKEINLKYLEFSGPSFWERKKLRQVPQKYPNEDSYGNLINNWIPAQPDMGELMHLFIKVGFDPYVFLGLLAGAFSDRALLKHISLKEKVDKNLIISHFKKFVEKTKKK